MNQRCEQCGTVYDVREFPEGHRFTCTCGRELVVGPRADRPPAVTGGGDPGLPPLAKVLVFFANLCFSPLAAIASLVVWLVIREEKPRTANDLCTFTWIPFLIAILLWGLYLVFVMGLALSGEFR